MLVALATAAIVVLSSSPTFAALAERSPTVSTPGVVTAATAPEVNEIVQENRRPGTSQWRIPWRGHVLANDVNVAIKGYASAVSVNRGEPVDIRVHAASAGPATWHLFRLGWYQGLGGRSMGSGSFTASPQPPCATQMSPEKTGLISCPWDDAVTLTTGADWTTGVYVVVLTRGTAQTYASFVVRDDAKTGALVHLQPALTAQAYNNFPNDRATGKSLYPYNSFGPITVNGTTGAVKASFDRPYANSGSGFVMTTDAPMIRYSESRGFDVTYAADSDLHANPDLLADHVGVLAIGHQEYWTGQMFTAAESAREAGVDTAFLGANNVYWQIRLEPSASGSADRVIVAYRQPDLDPVKDADATVLFRNLVPDSRPEQPLIGQMWVGDATGMTYRDDPWVVQQADHWLYRGTGLSDGSQIPLLVGIEADRRLPNFPAPALLEGTTQAVLARSPYLIRSGSGTATHEATLYQAPSGAYVFSAGTLRYVRGLLGEGPGAQQSVRTMTMNLLARFHELALNASTERIGGLDRYETAVELSKYAFPGDTPVGVPRVYLATGVNYPDALAAAAATQGAGPVLLVPGATIPDVVLDELARLRPTELVVVGGEAIVSTSAANDASVAAGTPAKRYSGLDRYETAADVSEHTFGPGVPVAYIATGVNYPDALAAGAAGAQLGGPVLLTRASELSARTRSELERLKPERIVVVGGSAVVTDRVADQLKQFAPSVVRLSGADRYETAMAVARDLGAPATFQSAIIATGVNFSDALAAGPAIAAQGGPLLLVGSSLSAGLAEELVRSDPRTVLVAGGYGAVPEGVETQIDALFAPVPVSPSAPPAPQRRLAEPPGDLDALESWRTKPAPFDEQPLPWVDLPADVWQYNPESE